MDKNLELLQLRFTELYKKNGCVTDVDYHTVCREVTDSEILCKVGNWLVSSGIVLRKAITPQYQQELMERVKNPNVNNVKDTKEHTHANPDKKQKSKVKITEVSGAEDHLAKALLSFQAADPVEYSERDERAALLNEAQKLRDPQVREQVQEAINSAPWQQFRGYWDMLRNLMTKPEKQYPMQQFQELINVDPQAGLPPEQKVEDQPLELETEPEAWKKWKSSKELEKIEDPVQKKLLTAAHKDYMCSEYISKIKKQIKFDTKNVFTVDVATTPSQKAAGLEVFEKLPDDHGLLFVFSPPDHVTFHMGKVKFPIDIIFLVEDNFGLKVSKIVHNVQPGDMNIWSCPKTSHVLELSGGSCEQRGIKIGNRCKLSSGLTD